MSRLTHSLVNRCLIPGLTLVAVLTVPTAIALAIDDEVLAVMNSMAAREAVVLEGIDWQWTDVSGRSDRIEDARKAEFKRDSPVDRFHCRWRARDGMYLYEIVAQQEQRFLENDAAQKTVLMTRGSETFLESRNSRLWFEGSSPVSGIANIDSRMGDFDAVKNPNFIPHRPGSAPVHTGCFGLGRVIPGLEFTVKSGGKLVLSDGVTSKGETARILRSVSEDETRVTEYFLRPTSFLILQATTYRKNALQRDVIVEKTQTIHPDGDDELGIELPTEYIEVHRSSQPAGWIFHKFSTVEIRADSPRPSEMRVKMNHPRFSLAGRGSLVTVNSVDEVSVETVDDLLETVRQRVKNLK